MSGDSARIPIGSQTVGPYFRIGLDYLIERTPALTLDTPGTIELRGQVLDRDGVPVPDAMLEFWSATTVQDVSNADRKQSGFPAGFRRAATDGDGRFCVVIEKPRTTGQDEEQMHAPHMLVMVFARGLLRHLLSRVYLGNERANETDPVLMAIPEDWRATLIARPDEGRVGLYWWDIILQGTRETVFFAW
jgi:protocatechuate 3,4-dioxygenase alpha subunit